MQEILWGVEGLSFTDKEFEEAKKQGSPLTVDMAIPSGCRNDCIYCGWADEPKGKGLKPKEILNFYRDFSEIGGKSARVLGRGEPLTRNDILAIFEYMNKVGVKPVLFTCGDIIGDDDYCITVHGMDGIELVKELKARNVSILLKYEKEQEDLITGVKGYSENRNRALERIIDTGFNLYSPSHIGLASVVLKENRNELLKIYESGLQENIYPFFCPIMPVGKAKNKGHRERIGITGQELVDLAVKFYILAFQYGIEYKGPSDFIATLPCFITKAGFYLDDSGDVTLCAPDRYFGNIREKSVTELWKGIDEFKRRLYGDTGCDEGKCFPKRHVGVIPRDYDEQVDRRVREYIAQHPNEFNSRKKKWDFRYIVR